ncbi:MAG: MBL fold metallo-hydrolase [Candidatus Odinarchaeota archaeon]
MAKISKDDLSSFNGSFITPEIILVRPEQGYFLSSNSLLFIDRTKLLVDTGILFGSDQLRAVNDFFKPDLVLLSHYHLDHVFGSHIFKESQKLIHRSEIAALSSLEDFFEFCYGSKAVTETEIDMWNQHFSSFLELESISGWDDLGLDNLKPVDNEYKLDIGDMIIEIIHLPGHSPGHCGLYEQNSQILFIGDISGKFGPWYGWENADLPQFRETVVKLRDFIENNAISLVVPSHSRPVEKQEYLKRLDVFNSVFDERKKQIMEFISKQESGTTITEITAQSFIYQGRGKEPDFVNEIFEKHHVEKHVEELASEGLVKYEEDKILVV